MKTFQILSLLLAILSASCTNSAIEDFVVGDNFIKDNTGVAMIDTFTLESSIVKFDSIISSSPSRFIVGSNYNPFSGYKSSNSFMEMRFDDNIGNTQFVFDSLNLVLYYDTYYFGDTTVTQTFTVHQLQEQMKLGADGYLYSTSKFKYNTDPLGSISFKPQPGSHQEISIRLSDALGKKLANMIKEKDDTLTNDYLFSKFFNGIMIKSQSEVKGAVVGFRTTNSASTDSESTSEVETKPEFRLYYHLSPNPSNLYNLYYKFSYVSDGIYFNQVSGNSANTLIDGISDSNNERSADLTNDQMIIQSGIQLFSKIKIPYIDNLLLMGKNQTFIGATLKLYPIKGTYQTDQLPDSLYVYSANLKNQLTGQITLQGSTTSMAFAKLIITRDVEEKVYYSIDVGNFINTELKEELETNRSLMIGYKSATAMKSANYLVLGGKNSGKYAPSLNVYYYHN